MKTETPSWRGTHRTVRLGQGGGRLRQTLLCLAVLLAVVPRPLFAQTSMSEVAKGVVRVWAGNEQASWSGSGFIINSEGYIVTNQHVVEDARVIKIMTSTIGEAQAEEVDRIYGPRLANESEDRVVQAVFDHLAPHLVDAEVVMTDANRDFAILRTTGLRDFRPLALVLSPQLEIGQEVRALGYPGSGDMAGLSSMLRLKISNGIIRSKEYVNQLDRPVYGITADISRGNSGGPLVTMCGEVSGLNTFGLLFERGPGVRDYANFAVQIDPVVTELRNRGINHQVVSVACVASVATGVPMWMMVLSMLLGGSALWMAATQRGRAVVSRGVSRVGSGLSRASHSVSRAVRREPRIPPPPSPPPSTRTRPVLYALGGPYKDSALELGDEPLTIGRDPRVSQLVFPPETSVVSKRHCKLTYSTSQRQFTLEDCWSTNGTYLGTGKRIEPDNPHTLRPGERFYVGDRKYLFEVRLEDQ